MEKKVRNRISVAVMLLIQWLWARKRALLVGAVIITIIAGAVIVFGDSSMYQVRLAYIYPGAERGTYPDGQRMLKNDLIDSDRVAEALEAMHQKGWYNDIPAAKILQNLRVDEHLSQPVQEKVGSMLSQGEAYTYYGNEFIITFVQPRVLTLKNSDYCFGLFRPDRSKEFVEELVNSVMKNFSAEHTEGSVFADFSDYMYVGDADYSDIVKIYENKVSLCINQLQKKMDEDSSFISSTTGLSFENLISGYQSLSDVQIARLLQYTSSEKLTRSLDELINSLEVEKDTQQLIQKKKQDESDIAKKAMMEYDHTFSENIIIVSVNEENGLYQARPKTAYDTVTQRSLNAGVAASNATNIVANDTRLIQEYTVSMNRFDVKDKLLLAESMVTDIQNEYEKLSELATTTIEEYQIQKYDNYIQTSDIIDENAAMKTVIKLCMIFVFGLGVMALICWIQERYAEKKAAGKEVK